MNNKIRALFVISILLSLFISIPAFSETVQYTYDNLNRITKAEYSDGTVIEYLYDAAGNRLNEKVVLGTYTITAGAGPNGAISPSGFVIVDHGTDQQFTITPDTGYHVADVKVDGFSIGPVSTHSFTNVTDSHTIEATFEADTFPDISVTPTSQDYGSLNVGSSSPAQTLTVSNTGDAELLIGSIFLTGTNATEFSIQNDNCSTQTLTPLGTCTVDIIFLPTSEGLKISNLSIPSNDPDTPQSNVQLAGVGNAPPQSDGDVAPFGNRDGTVNVGDALVALRFALELEVPTQENMQHGDVAPLDASGQPNPDGKITVGDALVILRKALGLIDF